MWKKMDTYRLLRRLLGVCLICLVAALVIFLRWSKPQPGEQADIRVQCGNGAGTRSGAINGALRDAMLSHSPSSRYYFNANYGWFDRSHFNTGDPGRLISDVHKTVQAGGGVVTLEQDVHDGVAGYTGSYYVSPQVTTANELGVALGIYRDWSTRFEGWQAQLPQTLVGMLSPYAVEDLPSQYVGFFAAANGLTVPDVFACYLPDTRETEEAPPRLTMRRAVASTGDTPLNYPQRLVNREMQPMIYRRGIGWVHLPWPAAMQMEVVGPESGLWAQVGDENWYFGDD